MTCRPAISLLALACGTVFADCVKIEGDRILAGSLISVAPPLAGIPADTVIGLSPRLGVVRWLAPELIQRFAARHAVRIDLSSPVCVERAGFALNPQDITAALTSALRRAGYADHSLHVLAYPREQLPRGELQFSIAGLSAPPPGGHSTTWRGRLLVQGGQSVPLVVRAEVSVKVTELLATHDLAPGQTITARDISQSQRLVVPTALPDSASPADAVGKQCRRAIRAGSTIRLHLLTAPPEIQRGDRVLVAASSGRASIAVETKAETAARVGQTVVLSNPDSGKRFKATVTGRGSAAIRLENHDDKTGHL